MVRKISNLNIGKTTVQDNQLWAEVLSHRNKLLATSDWTQSVDSGLTEVCVRQWRDWRRQLKNINRSNYGDRDSAEAHINNLARRIPFNVYVENGSEPEPDRYPSLDEYRSRVLAYLDTAFNEQCNTSFHSNPTLVNAQYLEALRYRLLFGIGKYPLLSATAALHSKSARVVAKECLEQQADLSARMAKLKVKYYEFRTLVCSAESDVQLTEVQAEIKQWISTST